MKFTRYFIEEVLPKRPDISKLCKSWCQLAIDKPIKRIIQQDGRIRHWVFIPEEQKYLRVITLSDGKTIHNAFFDRNFKRNYL